MTSRPVDVVERGHAKNALPRLLWVWMLLLLLACHARAQAPFKPVPPLRTRVTDEVGMLTPDQRQQLESALAYYETKRGSQIAVAIVASHCHHRGVHRDPCRQAFPPHVTADPPRATRHDIR